MLSWPLATLNLTVGAHRLQRSSWNRYRRLACILVGAMPENLSPVTPEGAPTIRDVADTAGVAVSSVSRVLNDHPDVSLAMKERVHRAIDDLGYEHNLLASGLRSGSTRLVGFIASDISNPLFAVFIQAAERTLSSAGYAMMLVNSEGDPGTDEVSIRLVRKRQVDGLIVSLSDEERSGTIAELQKVQGPIVLLDRVVDGVNASVVMANHSHGLRVATDHLLELGHRRIALISGRKEIRPTRDRVRGYSEAFRAKGFDVPTELLRLESFATEFAEKATRDLLRTDNPPTAIISGGNMLLTGILRIVRNGGLTVGRDIDIISCDDVPLAELYSPPITVIDRDAEAFGRLAAEHLLRRLADPEAPVETEITPTMILLRESTHSVV